MKRILASNSAYGQGGIGQHFAQLVEESRRSGHLAGYYCPAPNAEDPLGIPLPIPSWHTWLARYTPVRLSPSWKNHLLNDLYDRSVATALNQSADRFMGFVGKSLHSFQAARRLGAHVLELVAANPHVDTVRRRHDHAAAETGIQDSWLNEAQRQKTLREYEAADRIYVHSDYTRRSFLEAGISRAKMHRTHLAVDARFRPPHTRPDDGIFRVVYVGRVDATKGIPLLLDAFAALSMPAELTLVGSWGTRNMRRYMNARLHADDRVRVAPGDPLPALQVADVFVHPSFEDGFGYAPMEALACGTPVVVTADTGMQEYVREGQNGFVVPTGNRDALVEHLRHLYQNPRARTTSLLPPSYYAEQRVAEPPGSLAAIPAAPTSSPASPHS